MQKIRIRKARPDDASALASIFLEARRSTFHWLDVKRFQLDDFHQQTAGEVIFLAEDTQAGVLGFISLWEADRFIHHLFVSPGHQRQGIGKLLLSSLGSWLPYPYRLKCFVKNRAALAFYRQNGWIEIDRGETLEGEYLLFESTSSA